ncbi:hypothetical protein [Lacipirellula limnantheis]|uniref:Uncharacterized protein n=1 Tax=Lacipirellula limnantheis TaxID=2528024 RepID=A0A517U535_9BACT|nr:hypothetical protein [Lacipirellula limnantheis]QDT75754.1 hypothetical protein I41_49960 [Lacipirellula limnantheis]
MPQATPASVGSSPEAKREFFHAEALAYQKSHNCRWSEATLAIKKRYAEAREAFGAPKG